MQTSEVALLRAKFDGLVKGPVASLVDVIKAGHLEAAGILAERVVPQMEAFAAELEALVPKAAPADVSVAAPVGG